MKSFYSLRKEAIGEEYLEEKNKPTSPEKWAKAKAAAKSKFAVYPSAYANAWASKKYKSMGGGWKATKEEVEHIDEMDKSQPSSSRGAEGLPLGKKADPVKTDKVKKDALKTLEKSYKKVKVQEAKDEEYSDPHMAVNQLKTIMHNAEELMDMLGDKTDLPEWVESKITLAEDYIMTVANYMRSEMHEEVQIDEISKETLTSYRQKAKTQADTLAKGFKPGDVKASTTIKKRDAGVLKAGTKLIKKSDAEHSKATQGPKKPPESAEAKWKKQNPNRPYWGEDVEQIDEATPAWQRKEGKNSSGGLNAKGVASYRREHPGSKLKTAVTTKPSKLKKGSKAAKRRKSFCARMSGMKKRLTSAKTARDPNSRINKSLRKWNC